MGSVIVHGDDASEVYETLANESGIKESTLAKSPGGSSKVVVSGFPEDEHSRLKDALCEYGPLRDDAVVFE